MILSVSCTVLGIIGVIAFFSGNIVLVIVGAVANIIEAIIQRIKGELKSFASCIIFALIGLIIFSLLKMNPFLGIALGLCFESAILGLTGDILAFIIFLKIRKKTKHAVNYNGSDELETEQENIIQPGMTFHQAKRAFPFIQDYVGQINPYTKLPIQCEADYDDYLSALLREHEIKMRKRIPTVKEPLPYMSTSQKTSKKKVVLIVLVVLALMFLSFYIGARTWYLWIFSPDHPPTSEYQYASTNTAKTDDEEEALPTYVYVTENGEKYHRATCNSIRWSETEKLTIMAAENRGYKPCKLCLKEASSTRSEEIRAMVEEMRKRGYTPKKPQAVIINPKTGEQRPAE